MYLKNFFKIIFFGFFLMLVLSPRSANAVVTCAGGLAERQIQWYSGVPIYRYCALGVLVDMKVGASQGACEAGETGKMFWSDAVTNIVWCDGADLWKISSGTGSGGCGAVAGAGLLAGSAGTLQWSSRFDKYYICDGLGWLDVP